VASLPRVCVIGAGSSGIAAVKALHERGFEPECFEASDRVGGNWVFKNANGMSAAYRSLHINTSRERMEFADFPMPKSYPDFPHHTHIARYFDAYVDHFGFRDRITFRRRVQRAWQGEDGGWTVALDSG
jgi:dimethylaniline monooxygenase (N-oxide forming)